MRKISKFIFASMFFAFSLFAEDWVSTGRVLWVDGTNGDDATAIADDALKPYKTINAAVLAMEKEDIVKIKSGTYNLTETITNSASFNDVNSAHLTIMGEDSENRPVINGDGKCVGFYLAGRGMLFKNLIVSNCYTASTSYSGAGISFRIADMCKTRSDSEVNWKKINLWNDGRKFENCLFVANTNAVSGQDGYGGGLGDRYALVYNCNFINNYGSKGGGIAGNFAYGNYAGGMIVSNCYFKGNTSTFSGGAAFMLERRNYGGHFYDCVFDSNYTRGYNNQSHNGQGGGALSFWSNGSVYRCVFTNNASYFRGGAINARHTNVTIWDSSFDSNRSGSTGSGRNDGSAICGYNDGTVYKLYVYNCSFKNHTTGANVLRFISTTVISNCVFEGNSKCVMYAQRTTANLTMRDTVFLNNKESCVSMTTEGLACKINNSVFSNNVSSSGAALNFVANVSGYVRNSLIVNNTNNHSSTFGGGIHFTCRAKTKMSVENCTIMGNVSKRGGGVYLSEISEDRPVFTNCIISLNVATSAGYEDSEANIRCSDIDTRFINCYTNNNPMFISGTYQLRPSSPCRDAGLNLAWMTEGVTDIYGNQRIYNGTTDIGASEAFWPLGMAIIIK